MQYSTAATKISYASIRSFLNREQLKKRPEIPQIVAEFQLTLLNYELTRHIYKGTVVSIEGYRAVIFTRRSVKCFSGKQGDIHGWDVFGSSQSITLRTTIHNSYAIYGYGYSCRLCYVQKTHDECEH
ncbi:uncharacterized protein LOC105193782 isoform X2 [Solenopsis invicta]|uniref:uncharacterized protein LOC105193782 isoform X2 n=1 Tax=Solenopsis invicta TaxID=13686 RepID=UPI00193D986F|nr:uncharacterized protein LOC105193782 isoform X2 [Solenopsis invicta]